MGDNGTTASPPTKAPTTGTMKSAEPTAVSLVRGVTEVCRLAMEANPRAFVAMSAVGVCAAAIPPLAVLLSATLAAQLEDGKAESPALAAVVAALWTLAIGQRFLAVVTANARAVFVRQAQYSIEARLLQRVSQAPLRQFDDAAWHDQLAKAKGDLNWKPGDAMWAALAMSSHAVALVLMSLLIARMHWSISLMAVISALAATRAERRLLTDQFKQRSDDTETQRERDYLGSVLTDPNCAGDLRACDATDRLLSRHELLTRQLIATAMAPVRRARGALLTGAVVSGSAVGASYAAVAYGAIGRADAGAIVLIVGGFGAVATALAQLTSAMLTLEHHGRFLVELTEFLRTPSENMTERRSESGATSVTTAKGEEDAVRLTDVSFTYPGAKTPTLSGLSLSVRRGECLAIVGHNGAGKSTLIKLLLRFYEPDSGAIYLDGKPTTELSRTECRQQLGVQLQALPLYEVPIADFVAFGRSEELRNNEAVNDAIARAQCGTLVERASAGVMTRLGRRFPGGQAVSGGEWQRLQLARTIYRDARVWVLDEPTAHLDASAHRVLEEVIASRPPDVAVVLVTHHWPVVAMASRVAVMRAGRIVEVGERDRLVRRNGALCELFGAQAKVLTPQ